MRVVAGSLIEFELAGTPVGPGTQTRVIQDADPVQLEAKLAAVIAEFVALNAGEPAQSWRMTHVDIAGGGDGHTFVISMEWGNGTSPNIDVIGAAPERLFVFLYMAAQSEAIQTARRQLQPRVDALFGLPDVAEVHLVQAMLAGASQGTRFMGGIVLQTVGVQ